MSWSPHGYCRRGLMSWKQHVYVHVYQDGGPQNQMMEDKMNAYNSTKAVVNPPWIETIMQKCRNQSTRN